MRLLKHYILEGHEPKAVTLEEWGAWFEKADQRRVAFTELSDKVCVSTVFLGLDHNFNKEGPPILFETMVFGYGGDYCYRASTWDEATAIHERTVAWLTAKLQREALRGAKKWI